MVPVFSKSAPSRQCAENFIKSIRAVDNTITLAAGIDARAVKAFKLIRRALSQS